MPLISYSCKCGKKVSKFFRLNKDVLSEINCECGSLFKRQLSTPSQASKIVVDNGFQAKSVEVDLEVIKSNLENSEKDQRSS